MDDQRSQQLLCVAKQCEDKTFLFKWKYVVEYDNNQSQRNMFKKEKQEISKGKAFWICTAFTELVGFL